jgi:hypothetical protein
MWKIFSWRTDIIQITIGTSQLTYNATLRCPAPRSLLSLLNFVIWDVRLSNINSACVMIFDLNHMQYDKFYHYVCPVTWSVTHERNTNMQFNLIPKPVHGIFSKRFTAVFCFINGYKRYANRYSCAEWGEWRVGRASLSPPSFSSQSIPSSHPLMHYTSHFPLLHAAKRKTSFANDFF